MTSKYQTKQQNTKKTSLAGTAPVAGKAVKGAPHRKMVLRLAQRCYAFDHPEDSKSWGNLVSQKGVHRPGSYK
jgi:hypothetical protein